MVLRTPLDSSYSKQNLCSSTQYFQGEQYFAIDYVLDVFFVQYECVRCKKKTKNTSFYVTTWPRIRHLMCYLADQMNTLLNNSARYWKLYRLSAICCNFYWRKKNCQLNLFSYRGRRNVILNCVPFQIMV